MYTEMNRFVYHLPFLDRSLKMFNPRSGGRARFVSINNEWRRFFSFPSSVWERIAPEALPRVAMQATYECSTIRQAETARQWVPRQSLRTSEKMFNPRSGGQARVPSRKISIALAWIVSLALIAGIALPGCDRSLAKKDNTSKDGKSASSASNAESSAQGRKILEACIAKYQKLKSYEDVGALTIRIPTSDPKSPRVISEPMRIAFDAPNRLAIQARNLQAMWSNNARTWEAVVGKDEFKPFGKQRLVRPLPETIDLTWLIVDNLGALLDDAIIGSPMQLQLLLDEKPLAYLLEPDSKISLIEAKEFESAKCDRVQCIVKDLRWVFWIDQQTLLLRKYEMPSQLIGLLVPGLPSNFDPTKAELSVEYFGAKANPSVDWRGWQIPNQIDDVPVRRLIDAPPGNTPALIGKQLDHFDLLGADGNRMLDSAQREKEITILGWVTKDERGEIFVKGLIELQRELDKRSLNKAEIILISRNRPFEILEPLKKWNSTFPLAFDIENLASKAFSLQNQPAVVVIDKQLRVQHIDEMGYLNVIPNIIEDLHRGVDIANRRLQHAIDDEERFNSRLHRAMVDKSQTEALPPIKAFPFTYHVMNEKWHATFSDTIIAASGENSYPQVGQPDASLDPFVANAKRQRVATVLDELGHVYAIDNAGVKSRIANIPIEQADNALRIHVLPDPWTHRWIAIVPEGLPRYWLIDASSNPIADPVDATQFDLDDNETLVSFAWTVVDGQPGLAVATSSSKLFVLNPETQKLRTANVGAVAAIVPTINQRGECLSWNVIRTNGDIEEIESLRSKSPSLSEEPSDSQRKKLTFEPQTSPWAWGRNRNEGVLLGMAKLPSGETGTISQTPLFVPRLRHPLSVRPEQCKILSTITLPDGSLYWLSTAPNRVLHLQTADGFVADQMSLGKRIVGAGLFPDGNNLRIVLAVDNEVNCWSIARPIAATQSGTDTVPARNPEAVSPSEKPGA